MHTTNDVATQDSPSASLYLDATEEAHYHPTAGPMWNRWMRACERRGIAYDAVALAEHALHNADARDPLTAYSRPCIFQRNGRECRSFAGRPCAADCDIPF
jgi:hypothetical protein